jgi:hypothetical protein
MTPLVSPSANARSSETSSVSESSSGASAIQPNAGYPNFGKLSARRTPDAEANEKV